MEQEHDTSGSSNAEKGHVLAGDVLRDALAIAIQSSPPASQSSPGSQMAKDASVVDWEGPDDPANPQNWPMWRKWSIIGVVSAVSFNV